MGPDPQAQNPLKGKTLEKIRQYVDSFNRLGQRLDANDRRLEQVDKSIAQLTEAVDELTDVLTMYADLAARASESPQPIETFMKLMAEVLRQRR